MLNDRRISAWAEIILILLTILAGIVHLEHRITELEVKIDALWTMHQPKAQQTGVFVK